jgi:hypothetical protein
MVCWRNNLIHRVNITWIKQKKISRSSAERWNWKNEQDFDSPINKKVSSKGSKFET